MTQMDCREVRDLVAPFVDDELDASDREAVTSHLSACAECRTALEDLTHLRAAIRSAGTHDVPVTLDARVRAAIGFEARRLRPTGARMIAALAASHLVVAGLGAAWGWQHIADRERTARVTGEIISAHVRSTLDANAIQVASSDQHTVRPWFAGKLDFAPPVRDLAADGFPLIGGRVDHVLGRRSAALVYARRKHRINVFVAPISDVAMPLSTARDGYALVSRRTGGFQFVAVSDLGIDELDAFMRLLAAGLDG